MYQAIRESERGGTAVMFGIMALPITLAIGLGIDYATMSADRAQVQNISDRAALAAANVLDATNAQIIAAVNASINEAKVAAKINTIDKVTVTFPGKDRINVQIDAYTPTSLLNIVSDRYAYTVTTETFRGVSGSLEVVFALDTTGSMQGEKLATLKVATKDLVSTLVEDTQSKVKFGIVPFAQYVLVGWSRRNEPWLDVEPDSTTTNRVCKTQQPVIKKYDCVTLQRTVYADGVPSVQSYQSCKQELGPPQEICTNVTTKQIWYGCVGSRNAPLNVSADNTTTKYPGLMNVTCGPKGITPLTDKVSTIRSEIDALSASGETYLPAGLMWGLNMLTPKAPASTAAAFDPDNRNTYPHKTLVLMTDGENTKSPTFPKHDGSDKALANKYTIDLCNNIKAKNIEIYTVAFQVTDTVTKAMLEGCATSTKHYFNATDSASLIAAFSKIADTLKQVRLAR
jgi:Flp pilus assembly protein TadG